MSLTDGLEYINTTKRKIKAQLQDKGVNVTDATPYIDYPDKLGSELKNKSWQYPTTWYQLTPKSEFPDHTIEMVAFDAEYKFKFQVRGTGTCTFTVFGNNNGGEYKLNGITKELNKSYTVSDSNFTLQFTKGTGILSNSAGFTTFKIVIAFSERLSSFSPEYIDTDHITYNPILTFRAKDTTSYGKTIYFGNSHKTGNETLNYRAENRFLQYCDLSMVDNLLSRAFQFYDCYQLVKCEFPTNFKLSNYSFYGDVNLREVLGADFTTIFTDRVYVFADCHSYTPISFNYVGSHCYCNCDISGMTIQLPPIKHYPEYFITKTDSANYKRLDNGVMSKAKIIIPDTVETMDYRALPDLSSEVIVQLPSSTVTLTTQPLYDSDSFLFRPFDIENGDNFYLDTPVKVSVNHEYGGKEVYLPHVPLKLFSANCYAPKGSLEKITFDWENTDFSDLSDTFSGYVIDIRGQQFSHDTLVELFNNLPDISAGGITRSIRVTYNPGVATLTEDEIEIVTNKGYILVK